MMQIADRALPPDRPVTRGLGVMRGGGERFSDRALGPDQEIDDVERADVAEQFADAVRSARF